MTDWPSTAVPKFRSGAAMISFMDEAIEKTLKQEFDAEEGSFLLRLRGDLEWDRAAFTRLERAMRVACEQSQGDEKLDRWLAEGFYEVAMWVPTWTSHPNFPRPTPDTYYEDCIERISDLTSWFFRGWHDYSEGHLWPDL
ncbi:hypothetical protein [Streptomyces mobaraensis]|uniref:hypothetical protein n=1 Tax=Streptomyces mobaraensis TaxID=35621 RepID=UPI0033C6E707